MRKRIYIFLLDLAERVAPPAIRAIQDEVLDRGVTAYREARTVKTEYLPFMRDGKRNHIAHVIAMHLEESGGDYDLEKSPSIRRLAQDLANILEP